jgi:hypothetical protein
MQVKRHPSSARYGANIYGTFFKIWKVFLPFLDWSSPSLE